MTLLAVIGFSLPLLCPFYAFAFPSVSLFRPGYNLEWINNLRSDYPLNSASIEWSFFGPLGLEPCARAPLALKAILIELRAVSRGVAGESCRNYAIAAWVDCPRALPSRPKSEANNTFSLRFNGRYVWTRLSWTEFRRPYAAQLPHPKCPAKLATIRPEPSRCSAETREHCRRTRVTDPRSR